MRREMVHGNVILQVDDLIHLIHNIFIWELIYGVSYSFILLDSIG